MTTKMEAGREKEHLLALKVMRLTKPSFATTIPVISEDRDLPGNLFVQALQADLAATKNIESFATGELLTLPQNFGNIFLGETFSCYISVHNDSNQAVQEILVKTDLQTSSQRLTLSGGNAKPSPSLEPENCIDEVVYHEVKELGTHILVCAVSYTTAMGEKMYFRKFFKFQVLKPLDVKTKFYNAESNAVYLEAQIQNITNGPMVMDKVTLEPSALYTAQELNSVPNSSEGETTFGNLNYLNPMDTRQYLFCLTPKSVETHDKSTTKGVTNIGKLDIVWKTHLGERGRLQTSQLQRMAPGYGDIRLTIEQIPDGVQLEQSFEVKCKVTNCCERTMDLLLVLQNQNNGLHWCGISGRQLGKLEPSDSMVLTLNLLASIPGLLSISGLRLTDTYLKRTYEHDDIAQIFVYSQQETGA
ncbi:trafficking protein particle complex subunit 13-like [Ptychodera flava]|uniref:trafficking protein particle complex subunit 13-like n=1 Tax=Ptychodera flava TaxID=63121 RepID=UPI00396A53D8